ncbi:glycoside hydrolase family 5 protein [Sodiomyces alcalophilus JCM 7366]|uniref:glycoside hydrolase family 5 protein n=1 Tax=Sodiomyces alcalophilus JCM 7366 TaxID=591952 RepID=UPI0039B3CE83
MGGLHSATDMTPLRSEPFGHSRWSGKTVWKAHDHPFTATTPDVGRNCHLQLAHWLEANDADWVLWALQGSYYVRDGQIDYDETWAAPDQDWNGWRNQAMKGLLGRIFDVTQGP